jgi:pSer/pThr/pTyr-binding forkhead associated (FHA) protein
VDSPIGPHKSTPAELKQRLEAERAGEPFLVYRDDSRRQQLCTLTAFSGPVTIGRDQELVVVLAWDPEVSRVHARVEQVGNTWMLQDEWSTNGSFINGERLLGPHRLEDGDTIKVGTTPIVFRNPRESSEQSTARAGSAPNRSNLTARQLKVLTALCRPYRGDATDAFPATNEEIAEELVLGVDSVKSHLKKLYEKFQIQHLAQNKKRTRLAALALEHGLVSERDFREGPQP